MPENPRGRGFGGLTAALRHRDLLLQLVITDLRGRYAGSVLGVFWNVIHPIVLIAIYTLVFSQVMRARLGPVSDSPFAFSIYLCAGILPWQVFAEIVQRSTGIFWEQANLVKKVSFPALLLHAYVTVVGAVNLILLGGILTIFLAVIGLLPPLSAGVAWVGLLILWLLFALGLGLLSSVLNVFFRDIAQIVTIVLQLWFWLTPIVYVVDILPERFAPFVRLNLLYHYAGISQALVLHGRIPEWTAWLVPVTSTSLALLLGLAVFRLLRTRIPDQL
jgi:lipopolysaccharide transport system permease protein